MKLRQLAKLVLVARENARRVGSTFKLREAIPDVSEADALRVMEIVQEIERFTEEHLASLDASVTTPHQGIDR